VRRAGPRLARLRAGRARLRRVRGPGAQRVLLRRRRLRREPVVLVRVRRARPADRRHEEPAREPARGRGARLVQPDRPGRHQAHRRLHRGPAQRFQRGRHQGTGRGRDQRVRRGGTSGARLSGRGDQRVRRAVPPLVPGGVPLRSGPRRRRDAFSPHQDD